MMSPQLMAILKVLVSRVLIGDENSFLQKKTLLAFQARPNRAGSPWRLVDVGPRTMSHFQAGGRRTIENAVRKARSPVSLGGVEGLIGVAGAERGVLAGEPKWAESSFEELFLQYYGQIVAVLFRLLGDRSRAEELTNDVFLKLYRFPPPPRSDGNLGGWLYRTATNLGIDALRAAARRQHYEQAAAHNALLTGGTTSPLEEVLREERCDRVRAVLAALKPAQAQILILRSAGLSYKELAESLGVQRGSVGTMLARSEAEFQRRYLEMYGDKEEL